MSSTAKVNVIIANCNYGRYITDAIKSVQDQTHPCSMTIIDDGSTDNSWDVIQKCVANGIVVDTKKIDNVEYFQVDLRTGPCLVIKFPQSVGPSAARNVGILNTLGYSDYYQILDADDYMYPTKVERLLAKAESDPRIGVVYGDYDIHNVETGNTLREYKEPFSLAKLASECIVHSGSLIRKQALLAVKDQFGIYDEQMRTAEDYDLWLRIARRFLICHVPEALTYVRVHKNNSTYSVDKNIWQQNWRRIQEKNGLLKQ
jgi:glycosyltransferase involved in cell wall biosynthesis